MSCPSSFNLLHQIPVEIASVRASCSSSKFIWILFYACLGWPGFTEQERSSWKVCSYCTLAERTHLPAAAAHSSRLPHTSHDRISSNNSNNIVIITTTPSASNRFCPATGPTVISFGTTVSFQAVHMPCVSSSEFVVFRRSSSSLSDDLKNSPLFPNFYRFYTDKSILHPLAPSPFLRPPHT